MQYFAKNRFSPLSLLILLGSGSALIYGLLLSRYPLLTYVTTPTKQLHILVTSSITARLLMSAGALLLCILFGLGLQAVRAARQHPLTPRLVVGFALLFSLLLLLTHPVTSSDLYDYLFRGRMVARYTANTFTVAPQVYSGDPLLPFVGWPHAVTAYGPVWEMLSWLVARLAGEAPAVWNAAADPVSVRLLRLLLAYKLLDTAGFLLCGGAIWWALGQVAPAQRCVGLYLWLWNPLVLWESVGAGHNDAWMLLPIMSAVGAVSLNSQLRRRPAVSRGALVDERRPTAIRESRLLTFAWPIAAPQPFPPATRALRSGAGVSRQAATAAAFPAVLVALSALVLLTIGALIKYMPLLLWPVMLAAAASRLPSWGQRYRLVVSAGLACAALIALAYAPFWQGWETLHNFSDRRAIYAASWINGFRWLLIWAGVGVDPAQTIAALVGLMLLVAGTAWTAWQAWRRPERIVSHIFWLMLWSIFVCNPAPQPWYMLWPLAMCALQPGRVRQAYAMNVCACLALLSYVVSSLVIPILGQ